jgi:hypothetical protein
MKILKIKSVDDIPENFTGIAEYKDGYKEWYKDELLHREDGPAVEWPSGLKIWFQNGKKHRTNGPALKRGNGEVQYWINGERTYKEAVEVYHALFPEESP